jgi:hypothetical protein
MDLPSSATTEFRETRSKRGQLVPRQVARVADGIRTRDIQIHNLVSADANHDGGNDLRQPARLGAHYLPTDTRQFAVLLGRHVTGDPGRPLNPG